MRALPRGERSSRVRASKSRWGPWSRLHEAALRDNVDLRDLEEAAAMYPAVRDGILRVADCVEPGPVRPFDDVTRAMVFMGLAVAGVVCGASGGLAREDRPAAQ